MRVVDHYIIFGIGDVEEGEVVHSVGILDWHL